MFKDRKDAAIQLARALHPYRHKQPLIAAIPRGGVETGYYIARELESDLIVVVARKLGYPGQPEAAFGAVAEDGSLYIHPRARSFVPEKVIQQVIEQENKEMKRRIRQYRQDRPLPSFRDRTVIIADDGIATGATLFSVIELCRKKHPGELVIAAPVSSVDMAGHLQDIANDVVILETPSDFYAVSQVYENFRNLDDEDVAEFLKKLSSPLRDQTRKPGNL